MAKRKFMTNAAATEPLLIPQGDLWTGRFTAMGSPCELLLETANETIARELLHIAHQEALRIQHKFSRYEKNNCVWEINNAHGKSITPDPETALLLHFSDQCFHMSNGLFDITSGSLGSIWQFDGSDKIPSQEQIDHLLPYVGWHKVHWENGELRLPKGMRIDFGGIGKEYAVDRCLLLMRHHAEIPMVVNFGGDLAVSGPLSDGSPWKIGIETPDKNRESDYVLEISAGALATSGDSRRFLFANNQRYSHILNPFTGWPIIDAPRSITVASGNCIQAGMLATFGLLHGANAETFLSEQGVPFWILR